MDAAESTSSNWPYSTGQPSTVKDASSGFSRSSMLTLTPPMTMRRFDSISRPSDTAITLGARGGASPISTVLGAAIGRPSQ